MRESRRFDKEPKEFFEEVAQVDRVTRVVKGGRRFRFRASVVVGNRKGKVGFGIAKGNDVSEAVKNAVKKAKKNMIVIPLTGFSIAHLVEGKFKGSRVLLKPASAGTGVIAGGGVRIVMDLAGVKNVLSKIHGSTNRLNAIQATLKALSLLRSKKEIFRLRGKEIMNKEVVNDKRETPISKVKKVKNEKMNKANQK